jgi:hypothetical protein
LATSQSAPQRSVSVRSSPVELRAYPSPFHWKIATVFLPERCARSKHPSAFLLVTASGDLEQGRVGRLSRWDLEELAK